MFYSYPDPDLLPLVLSNERLSFVKNNLPELPREKENRFKDSLGLSQYDAAVLTSDREVAHYFESALQTHSNAKGIANWIINDILRIVKVQNGEDAAISDCSISAKHVAQLVKLIDDKVISSKTAKSVFEEMLADSKKDPWQIVEEKGWRIEKDEAVLTNAIAQVIAQFPDEVQKCQAGKTQLFGFLMGQVMKMTAGKVDAKEATALLKKTIDALL